MTEPDDISAKFETVLEFDLPPISKARVVLHKETGLFHGSIIALGIMVEATSKEEAVELLLSAYSEFDAKSYLDED